MDMKIHIALPVNLSFTESGIDSAVITDRHLTVFIDNEWVSVWELRDRTRRLKRDLSLERSDVIKASGHGSREYFMAFLDSLPHPQSTMERWDDMKKGLAGHWAAYHGEVGHED